MPDILFDKELTLEFGGKEIILRDYGRNHGTGITVMILPQDRVVAVFDIIYPRRLLWYNMPDYSPRAILTSLREIYKEDFDLCITAHGPAATRADFAEFIGFMDDLVAQVDKQVRTHFDKGYVAALEIAMREVDLSKYKDWSFYKEWRDRNVEATFHSIYMGF